MIKKNKVLTRVMIVVVVTIYGTIFYRSMSGPSVEDEISNGSQIADFSPYLYKKDSFSLELPLNDPFSKSDRYMMTQVARVTAAPVQSNTVRNFVRGQVPLIAKEKVWPTIKYFGFIKNTEKNEKLSFLSINGKLLKIAKMDQYEEVAISNIYKDSIQLVFAGEQKTFFKNK